MGKWFHLYCGKHTGNSLLVRVLDACLNRRLHPKLNLKQDSSAIRLVRLLPGVGEADLRCLLVVGFSTQSNYMALSDCWGNNGNTESIWLNGRPFKVTPNLFTALENLRETDEEVVIWIDAICINQLDTKERNHQVQQTRAIYHGAREVKVWLEGDKEAILHIKNSLRVDSDWWNRVWTIGEIALFRKASVRWWDTWLPWHALERLLREGSKEHEDFIRRESWRNRTTRDGDEELISFKRKKVLVCSLIPDLHRGISKSLFQLLTTSEIDRLQILGTSCMHFWV